MMWGQKILGIVFLIAPMGQGESQNDQDFKMCGAWHHGNGSRRLEFNLTQGCGDLYISADETRLSIRGAITASHRQPGSIQLDSTQGSVSSFCVLWEPLVDHLQVEVNGKNHTLLKAAGLQKHCCTNISPGLDVLNQTFYGIVNGSMWTDVMSYNTRKAYSFFGQQINCEKEFCAKAQEAIRRVNMIEEAMMKSDVLGAVNSACFQGEVVEIDDSFTGRDITLPASRLPQLPKPLVHLPASLKPKGRRVKVVCTYFKNSTIFNKGFGKKSPDSRILEDVVGISVENTLIRELPEPVKISFHHPALPKNYSRKCVSWDTRTAPNEIEWKSHGCNTVTIHDTMTECHCNHLTYFSILVQIDRSNSRCHLEALTFITAIGCAISAISCVILFYSLCKKRKNKAKDQSALIHRGLVVTLFFLSIIFILTGLLANVGGEPMCRVVGALLHYTLLCSFSWMAVEIFHTFWMVYMIFSSQPKPAVWYMLGFGVPVLPVGILVSRDDIYGLRQVWSTDDPDNPYVICWMKDTDNAWLAHYMTNVGFMIILVSTGLVMLFVILVKIRKRDEWRKWKLAFLSILGLSCLYGTIWVLGPLDSYCPVTFLFAIINTLQGFFIMLRYYALERMRKRRDSILDGSSSGSTRQHMLQPHERSYTKGVSE